MRKLCVLGSTCVPTKCSSHSIGTCAVFSTFFTDSAISGPMPSPGKRVALMGCSVVVKLRKMVFVVGAELGFVIRLRM